MIDFLNNSINVLDNDADSFNLKNNCSPSSREVTSPIQATFAQKKQFEIHTVFFAVEDFFFVMIEDLTSANKSKTKMNIFSHSDTSRDC